MTKLEEQLFCFICEEFGTTKFSSEDFERAFKTTKRDILFKNTLPVKVFFYAQLQRIHVKYGQGILRFFPRNGCTRPTMYQAAFIPTREDLCEKTDCLTALL